MKPSKRAVAAKKATTAKKAAAAKTSKKKVAAKKVAAAKKSTRKPAAAAVPPAVPVESVDTELVTVFFGWYDNVKFSSGERARTFLQLAVESHEDHRLVPLLDEKDVMLEITVRRFM